MSIIIYQKDFPVCKEFDLKRFIQILDEENFGPFLLILERVSDHMYYGQFKSIKSLLPPFVVGGGRGDIVNQIFLTECKFEWLQSSGTIRITASTGSTTTIVFSIVMIGFVAVACGAIIRNGILALIFFIGLIILYLLWNYYWDARRYNDIGQIASESKKFAQ
jgi:hypothetical protein